jgi:hypothetical protein
MTHPFPLPAGAQSAWTLREHQAAANHYWYEAQGYNESAYQCGDCDANYKPMQTMMLAAHADHTRKAQALRRAQVHSLID